jgi:hypothetical protein
VEGGKSGRLRFCDTEHTALLCGQHLTVINRTQMAGYGKPDEIWKQFCLWLWAIIEETDISDLRITLRKSRHFPVALLNFLEIATRQPRHFTLTSARGQEIGAFRLYQ